VTIEQVAARAGISRQTVSRVINDKPEVAPATRARVLEAIDALNYQPSRAARVLAKRHTAIIGLVIPFDPDFLFTDSHLMQIIHGVDREITHRDHSLLLSTPVSRDRPLSAAERLTKDRLVDGVIVEGGLGDGGARLLADKGYHVVVVGYTDADIPSVHPDDYGGAYNLTQHLLALGHRRVGAICGPDSIAMACRCRGYERACVDAGLACDPQLMTQGDFTYPSGYDATEHLMRRPRPPTAIFAFNDRMALGAMSWLREHGYTVPDCVSVVGFDDNPQSELADPPLTTVRIFSADLGRRASELLFDLMEGSELPAAEVVLPCQLVVRQSTASLNRGQA
jgi:DNA-binding LacI/PurR family transcriptional regulator